MSMVAVTLQMIILVNQPRSFIIAVIGFRGTGKTVFLTALFDRLLRKEIPGFDFAPYGAETLERVTENLNTLALGRWLPSTTNEDVFYFRAQAVFKRGLVPKRLKLEIGDYPGESSEQLASDVGKRLHKSDYFKDVVQSDAVFLTIGCDELRDSSRQSLKIIENELMAALNYLKESKGVLVGRRMRTPLAIILTKADVLGDIERKYEAVAAEAMNLFAQRMPGLLAHAQKIASSFSCFVVSAVGHLGPDGKPPEILKGVGVEKPLLWVLKRLYG